MAYIIYVHVRVISNIFIIDLQILKYILISNNNFIIIFLYKLVNIYNVLYSSHSQTAGRRSCNWLLSLSQDILLSIKPHLYSVNGDDGERSSGEFFCCGRCYCGK